MNPLFKLLSNTDTNNNASDTSGVMPLVRRAISAAMLGQSPEQFLNGLAQTDNRFQGMDFTNLEKTAKKVCGKKNLDLSDAVNIVTSKIKSMKW